MKIFNNYSLRDWNTFGMNVSAAVFAEYDNVDELKELLARYKNEDILHIGRGSNLLFTGDYHGVVLHSNIKFTDSEVCGDSVICRVGSGVVFDDFVTYAVNQGWSGAENLSYIPGEVGASAVQNIGAYGVEVKDIISRVYAIEVATLTERMFSVDECKYGYRDSVFKNELKGRYIITAVEYKLSAKQVINISYGNLRSALRDIASPTIADVRQAIICVRRAKLPEVSELGSAGSFFKNPVISRGQFSNLQALYPLIPHYDAVGGIKVPAAWLIEQCGLKGKKVGGAQIYEKQPLVIVNTGEALPQDIVQLAEMVKNSVKEKFDIEINPEVNYI